MVENFVIQDVFVVPSFFIPTPRQNNLDVFVLINMHPNS